MNEITPSQQYHLNKLNNLQSKIPFGQPSLTSPPQQFYMNNRQYLQDDHQEKRQYFQTPQPQRKQFTSAKPFGIIGGSPEVIKKSFEQEKDYLHKNLNSNNQKKSFDNHNFFSKLSSNVLNSNLNAFSKMSIAQQEAELQKMKAKNAQNKNIINEHSYIQSSNALKSNEVTTRNQSLNPYMRYKKLFTYTHKIGNKDIFKNNQNRNVSNDQKYPLHLPPIKQGFDQEKHQFKQQIIQTLYLILLQHNMGNKSSKRQIHAFLRDSLIRIKIYQTIFKKAQYIGAQNENGQSSIDRQTNIDFKTVQDSKKKTLVIDMDETLIHSVQNKRYGKHSVIVNSPLQRYEVYLQFIIDNQLFFNIRPYAIQFLERLSQYYELIIFSASTEPYITAIINYLDPAHSLISYHLSRNYCYVSPQGYFVKDLRVIPRNQNNILLIDNLAISYAFNLPNAIPVLEWQGDIMDDQLNYIAEFLEQIEREDDLSIACGSYFRLEELEKMTKIDLGIH